MARLLFVARDMNLARVRCHVWRSAGYEALPSTFEDARQLQNWRFEIVVISYHLSEDQRVAVREWFPRCHIVELPRHTVGRGLIDVLKFSD